MIEHTQNEHNIVENVNRFFCGHCEQSFTRANNLVRHLKNIHNYERSFRCRGCNTFYGNESELNSHIVSEHAIDRAPPTKPSREYEINLKNERQSIRGNFRIFELNISKNDQLDPFEFMVHQQENIRQFIDHQREQHGSLKYGICLKVDFLKPLEEVTTCSYFNSQLTETVSPVSFEEYFEHVDQLISQINIFCTAGSGWVIDRLASLEIKTCRYKPMRAGSYIPTPKTLKGLRKSLLNIKNVQDNLCFIYCILAALFPVEKNQERVSNYMNKLGNLSFDSTKMPMPLREINRFEQANNLKINVYCFEEPRTIYPIYLSKSKSGQQIHLMLISDGVLSDYCLIKNLDRLLKVLLRSERTARSKNNKRKFCERCLQSVVTTKLKQHLRLCKTTDPMLVHMPEQGSKIFFKSWQKTLKCPFVVYADFEAIDVRTEAFQQVLNDYSGTTLNTARASTHIVEYQYACSFGAILIDTRTNAVEKKKFFRGENCVQIFLQTVRNWLRWTSQEKQRYRWLPLRRSERDDYVRNWNGPCCICQRDLEDEDDQVVHHCHVTGKIYGVAHSKCNLSATINNFLPIFFHNLSRYDAHHIIKNLELEENESMSAISRTEETFISFSVSVPVSSYKDKNGLEKLVRHELRFLDSFNFMSQGLDSLGKTLQVADLKLLRTEFSNLTDEEFECTRKKGHFPYNYLDSHEKFNSDFPPLGEAWRNTLSGKIEITPQQWQEAKDLYDMFSCKNFGDYHDIYLKVDVFLLADIFEKFRMVCLDVYQLDPAHFYSAPNLSWDAMLSTTKVELELLHDYDMLLFCENAIRGGLNGVGSLRHFRANNKDLDDFNPDETSVYGAFLDVTSLYGGIMMKKLPLGNYQWITNKTLEDLINHSTDANVGYFVEVDFSYPHHLHYSHQDMPLAPEKLVIKDEWLSSYSRQFGLSRAKVPKLVETLFDKKNYICHIENLKFYVSQGLIVTKVHRILQFDQSNWLKSYIEKNTVMRKKATTTFEKNFYKLMSNACFGKTMENKRHRRDVRFVTTEQRALEMTAKPTFKSFQVISDNLCSLSFSQPQIWWDKPTPVGASILDLSKLALYGFHYNEMKPRYGKRILLNYKDTDSLLYRIETDDLYKDMGEFKHLLDLSDYPTDHQLYDPTNKKVPLTMTDELNGKVFRESVILRSKLYSIEFTDGVKQSAKSVQQNIKKSLHHDNFLSCLLTKETKRAAMTRIMSSNHQIQVITTNKIALSCFDDKRYILDDGITTLPYGHFFMNQSNDSQDSDIDDDDDDASPSGTTELPADFQQDSGDEESSEDDDDDDENSSSTFDVDLRTCNQSAAAAVHAIDSDASSYDLPDPGFAPRRDDDDSNDIVDWDELSNQQIDDDDEQGGGASPQNPFILFEAEEEDNGGGGGSPRKKKLKTG